MSLMATACPEAEPRAQLLVRRPLSCGHGRATQALPQRPVTLALGTVRTKDSSLDSVGWKQKR